MRFDQELDMKRGDKGLLVVTPYTMLAIDLNMTKSVSCAITLRARNGQLPLF